MEVAFPPVNMIYTVMSGWVNAGDDFSKFFTPDESKLGDDTYPMPSSRQLTADWLMRL